MTDGAPTQYLVAASIDGFIATEDNREVPRVPGADVRFTRAPVREVPPR